MRNTKVIALALVLVFVVSCFAGCGAEKVSRTVNIIIEAGDEYILNNVQITVEGTIDAPPTVLQAVREALQTYEINYTLVDNEKSIKDISTFKDTSDDSGNLYYWEYTVNGIIPDEASGKASDNLINDNDVIKYSYVVMSIIDGKTVVVPYVAPAEGEEVADESAQ